MAFKRVGIPKALFSSWGSCMETVRGAAQCWGLSWDRDSQQLKAVLFLSVLVGVGGSGFLTPWRLCRP